jgi:hypothetical protein
MVSLSRRSSKSRPQTLRTVGTEAGAGETRGDSRLWDYGGWNRWQIKIAIEGAMGQDKPTADDNTATNRTRKEYYNMSNDISTFKHSLSDEIKALQRAVARLTHLTARLLDLEERRCAALREKGYLY